jgi:hypothetical protein
MLTVGGFAVAPLVYSSLSLPSSGSAAAPSAGFRVARIAAQPPPGMSWIQGTLTDQAGHRLNNVNVEAWSPDPSDLGPLASNLSYDGGPVASNLSYAGSYADPLHQSGVFRLEVPARAAYRLTFSTINGQEDGDKFRMLTYGRGRPIMARTVPGAAAPAAVVALPGRIINLGTIQLARQGHVSSTTSVRLAKKRIKARHHARAQIALRSPYVSRVTGPVRIKVGKKSITRRVWPGDGGTIVVRLPKVKPGKRLVHVRFKGSSTVAASRAHPVRLVVKKHKG